MSAGEGVEKSGASRVADGNAHRSGHCGKRRGASSKLQKQSSPGTRQSRRGSSLNEKENTNSRGYTAPCSQQPRPHSTEKGGGHPAVCGSAGGPQGRRAKRNEPDRERQTLHDLAPTANLTAQTNEAAELVDGEEVDLQSSYHKKKKNNLSLPVCGEGCEPDRSCTSIEASCRKPEANGMAYVNHTVI